MSSNGFFDVVYKLKKVNVDYTPTWGRGNPNSYIDNLTFPKVLTDKEYEYRIVTGSKDLGSKKAYPVASDGSQRLNLLEWNSGYGVADTTTIKIYIIDPTNNTSSLIAQWK